MSKFVKCLTETGDKLLQKRAAALETETKEAFEDQKRQIEKEIRSLENDITSMEDLSIKTTQDLIVGENLKSDQWVNRRINIALRLRDLKVELDTVNDLIAEYFS